MLPPNAASSTPMIRPTLKEGICPRLRPMRTEKALYTGRTKRNPSSIAPSGCLARTDDGSVLAGVFADQFSGKPLSPGLHYVVIERSGPLITVRHPSGSDTSLTLELPPDWDLSGGVQVRAMARGNQAIAAVSAAVDDRRLTFLCARGTSSAPVDRYEITSTRSATPNSKP